jgi:predicted outer membrane protein
MKFRMGLVLPALIALAGCATSSDNNAAPVVANKPTMAAPQQVDAVSQALGQRMDSMVASRHAAVSDVTR